MVDKIESVIILGGGPAGLSAALYTARADLKPLVIEGKSSEAGGQLMWTTDIENYLGFEAIAGPELITKMRAHAGKFGATSHEFGCLESLLRAWIYTPS